MQSTGSSGRSETRTMATDRFEEAGDDGDLRDAHTLSQWQDRRSVGLAYLERAKALLDSGDHEHAEEVARQALKQMRSALNWAEFGPIEDQAHRELDEYGRWVRETFGCHLSREGETYSQT